MSMPVSTTVASFPPPPNPYNVTPKMLGHVNGMFAQASSSGQIAGAIGQITEILGRRTRRQKTKGDGGAIALPFPQLLTVSSVLTFVIPGADHAERCA